MRAPAVETDIPARMDRLPWSRFHLLIVAALGTGWILDGLEVTIVGSIGPILQDKRTLALSDQAIGTVAAFYVAGAVTGAVLFGWLTDRFGRRVIFRATLATYVVGVVLTACSWNLASFALFRLLTGLGIGGEYAAINSAIDELMPARLRGRIDLAVNGSYWGGAVIGAAASLLLVGGRLIDIDLGWRLGFAIGGVLGIGVLVLRGLVPESPRWLITHGREEHAKAALADIERRVSRSAGALPPPEDRRLTVHPRPTFGFGVVLGAMTGKYRARSLVALSLMVGQAFLFNAVFFTYGLVLARFYNIPDQEAGMFILPLAAGNFFGPLLLGHLFDTVGRRRMIAGTYILSGALLAATAVLFAAGALTAWTQTICWIIIFFFASAAASSAYLTASETFPLETRALAIALFYAAGTAAGGVLAPYIFGVLIATGEPWVMACGYFGAAALLIGAGVIEALFGVDAEGKSLEAIADPISS